ncbi:MAG: twin-arginine translocation signal domain-containing protein, partial [Planctomycetota bacterium]
MNQREMNQQAVCRELTRRTFLGRSAGGIGSIALASLLNPELRAGEGTLPTWHHPPKAKRVIFLFMAG